MPTDRPPHRDISLARLVPTLLGGALRSAAALIDPPPSSSGRAAPVSTAAPRPWLLSVDRHKNASAWVGVDPHNAIIEAARCDHDTQLSPQRLLSQALTRALAPITDGSQVHVVTEDGHLITGLLLIAAERPDSPVMSQNQRTLHHQLRTTINDKRLTVTPVRAHREQPRTILISLLADQLAKAEGLRTELTALPGAPSRRWTVTADGSFSPHSGHARPGAWAAVLCSPDRGMHRELTGVLPPSSVPANLSESMLAEIAGVEAGIAALPHRASAVIRTDLTPLVHQLAEGAPQWRRGGNTPRRHPLHRISALVRERELDLVVSQVFASNHDLAHDLADTLSRATSARAGLESEILEGVGDFSSKTGDT